MTVAGKISQIDNIYHQVRSHGDAGQPDDTGQLPQPVRPVDRVTLSKEALDQYRRGSDESRVIKSEEDLSPEEKQAVNDLKRRDAEVKAHEAAHMAAGGGVVQGGASYEYQSGPDGKMYAVGGEVRIDMSSAGSPEATIRKMQQIQRAALAPAQPSGTDRAVAAQASQIEAQARLEKNREAKKSTENPNAASPISTDPVQSHEAEPASRPTGARIDYMA